MKKEKRPLTEEEKQAKKENAQGWLFMIFFLVAFIVMFALYGMQSALFGGGWRIFGLFVKKLKNF